MLFLFFEFSKNPTIARLYSFRLNKTQQKCIFCKRTKTNKRGLNEKGPVCLKCKIGDETKMNKKLKIDEVIKSFGNKPFTRDELYRFYLVKEPKLKEMTFRGRVHRLKNENIIYSLKRGLYTAKRKNNFIPPIDKQLKNLYKKINARLYPIYLFHYMEVGH